MNGTANGTGEWARGFCSSPAVTGGGRTELGAALVRENEFLLR